MYDPKFNIVSPGADPELYFPYYDSARRLTDRQPAIRELLFGSATGPDLGRGVLEQPSKPALFTMARLDRVKNLTGGWGCGKAGLRELHCRL